MVRLAGGWTAVGEWLRESLSVIPLCNRGIPVLVLVVSRVEVGRVSQPGRKTWSLFIALLERIKLPLGNRLLILWIQGEAGIPL